MLGTAGRGVRRPRPPGDLVRPPRHRRQHPRRLAGRRRRGSTPTTPPTCCARLDADPGHRARLQLRRRGRARPGRPAPRPGARGDRLGTGRGRPAARRRRHARRAGGARSTHTSPRTPATGRARYRVMLDVLSDGRADLDAPGGASDAPATPRRRCATTPAIITRHLRPGELPAERVTRRGQRRRASPLHAAIADRARRARLGRAPLVVEAADDHEVYLTAPEILAAALGDRAGARALR